MSGDYRKVETQLVTEKDARATSADLARLREIAHVMDSLFEIPVVRWRIGLDGLIGLIPGFGDFVGFLVSGYFVLIAARIDVPRSILARMVLNIVVEATVGVIPILGDLFDFAWKANIKNLELLERAVIDPRRTGRRSLGFLLAIGLALFGLLILVVWMIIAVLSWALSWIMSIFSSPPFAA